VSHDWSDLQPVLLVAFLSSVFASNQVFKSSSLQVCTWLLGHSATRLLTFYVYKLINYLMLLIKPFIIAMISSIFNGIEVAALLI
jgi:hypothetical protein